MHDSAGFPYLREILLFLVVAGVLIPLLQRLRVNQVVGFLAAGVLLGPFGLGLWADRLPWLAVVTFPKLDGVAVLAELGVLFLMFMIGLELSAERLWSLRRWVFGAGTAQLVASAALIGGLAWLFDNPWPVATVLGLVLALSSTAVVVQLLTERRMLGTPLGQACFSILMLQDLAVVPLLIGVDALTSLQGPGASVEEAAGGFGGTAALVGWSLLKAAGAVVAIALIGRRAIRPVFRTLAGHRRPDVFMALTLLATLSIAGLTAAAGLSMALGAMLAGILLAETEFRHEVEVTIEPFRGLLMGLFFMSVGMGIDLRELARSPVWLPLSVLGLFAVKASVAAAVLRAGGLSSGRALEGGLLLGQGGEFAFIIVGVAMLQGLMPTHVGQFMLLVVGLSLVFTPFAARVGQVLGDRIDHASRSRTAGGDEPGVDAATSGHVVIAGFGRVGEAIAQVLDAQGVRWVAIEADATRVAACRAHGAPVWVGNATRAELLHRLRVADAAAVVLTMDQAASALHALRAIRREDPRVVVIARSRDEAHAAVLRDEGATVVIPETLEASLQLSAMVLQATGFDEPAAADIVDAERERRIGLLRG